ncbi:hypothetical protein BDR04DRAFT_1118164 [Suillus decipiens]|nr:hypothetical protein BDR04DRAFT_1118164 [Suillus decipiens]
MIQPGIKSNLNTMPEWRYNHEAINGLRKDHVHNVLVHVPLVQNDQWHRRAWMIHAPAALQAKGSNFSTIPGVTNGVQADSKLKRFNDMAKDRILKRRHNRVIDVLHLDTKSVDSTRY